MKDLQIKPETMKPLEEEKKGGGLSGGEGRSSLQKERGEEGQPAEEEGTFTSYLSYRNLICKIKNQELKH